MLQGRSGPDQPRGQGQPRGGDRSPWRGPDDAAGQDHAWLTADALEGLEENVAAVPLHLSSVAILPQIVSANAQS